MVKKLLTLAMGLIAASVMMAQSAPKSVTITESDIQFWTGTGTNSTVVAIGWDDVDANYTPTVVVWGVHWNGTITLQNALDTIMAYDSRFSYTISGSFLTSLSYVDPSAGVSLTPSASYNCNSYGSVYSSTNLTSNWLRISESTCDNYNFTGVNNLIYASNPNGGTSLPDTVDASLPFSDILFWVGTGTDSAVLIVNFGIPDTAFAWGYLFNGSTTTQQMTDAITAADPRFTVVGLPSMYPDGDIFFILDNGDTLSLSGRDTDNPYNYWEANINGNPSYTGAGQTLVNGDVFKYGDQRAPSRVCLDYYDVWCLQSAWTKAPTPVMPPQTTPETPVEATIAFEDILYWVGTGSNEAVLAVNWADTALAWGYRWNGSATVADMMADIAAADPRFSYSGSGWIDDIFFNDGTVSLAGTPGNYWGSTNNGVMDAGMGQALANGDFEKWGDPAAGVVIDSNNYGGPIWYYTYAYTMTIHPVSVPSTTPETPVEATIAFSDILYWVGTGSNEAVLAVNWPDTALAWGYRWNGTKTVGDMLDEVSAADPRFSTVPGAYGIDDILFVENGDTLRKSEYSWWGSTNNGVTDWGISQSLNNGDFEKWAEGTTGILVDSANYIYVYPMTIHPVSVPEGTPENATIAAEDILYWVGEGQNEAIFVVNWATKAYAWGYRFSTDSIMLSSLMDDLMYYDERFSYEAVGYMIQDIHYDEGTEHLSLTPGREFELAINNVFKASTMNFVHAGDFVRWADPAGGICVDSLYYPALDWTQYFYVYPMPITPVEPPYVAGPFCGIAGSEGCNAIAADSSAIVAWATGCTVELGPQNISVEGSPLVSYHTAQDAIGPCNMTDNLSVVSLGDGGSATVTFADPIANGDGPDFAVFENSWGDYFLELAFVEVSSDGVRFVRFPATSLTQTNTQVVSSVDPTYINNLAGKFRMGYGTPFDLDELRDSIGLDINAITHVRVVDVVGSIDPQYATYDAFGHIVNDPWPTDSYSGGFDLDGIAVLGHDATAVDDVESTTISIYPNPATDRLQVVANRADKAEMFDFSGRLIATYSITEGNNSIDISALPAGVYMLRTAGTVQKIVKM